jgi:hypothetical protein
MERQFWGLLPNGEMPRAPVLVDLGENPGDGIAARAVEPVAAVRVG